LLMSGLKLFNLFFMPHYHFRNVEADRFYVAFFLHYAKRFTEIVIFERN
jgi:hypothetical protein